MSSFADGRRMPCAFQAWLCVGIVGATLLSIAGCQSTSATMRPPGAVTSVDGRFSDDGAPIWERPLTEDERLIRPLAVDSGVEN
ncbi:hypothetical protein [Notoacmeibacter ruber]|uniref:Uncharacterized protein n=1 Tax=Notoacmeibacter ruber TaxID=2670375 RepID=A0A3L7J927_9HYPH|nr:hypothetical protein [Notoacmeibacter ruber]RLQ86934.1 hypothetical protein D8780_00650 [Notoacmeibacter ruber]